MIPHDPLEALPGGFFDSNRPRILSPTLLTGPRGTVPNHITFGRMAIDGIYAENDVVRFDEVAKIGTVDRKILP